MAAAMVGTAFSPPLWTGQDWRPILGTSVDTRILPPHLSSKESLLLLSQWIRIPRDDLQIRHATNSWLSPDKVKVEPDCDEEIWIFGALCLYWCDVELHMYPIVVSGDSFWERRFLF